jgi:ketosteroid isomerase-like protein
MNRTLIPFLALTLYVTVSAQTAAQSQTGTSQTGTQSPTSTQQPSTGMQQPSTGMQTPAPSASQGMSQSAGGTEQQILSLEDQLRQATVKNDPSFLEQHSTNDYVSIVGSGMQMPKTQMIQALRSGDIRYQSIEPVGRPTVRVYGDTAIVNGEAAVQATSYGKPISGNFRYTRVWVRQGGDWKAASFESTPEQPQTK